MMSSIKRISVFIPQGTRFAAMSQVGDLGSGAGRGGGGGGSIRDAGGSFGRMEAAHEEEYFHKKTAQMLRSMQNKQRVQDIALKSGISALGSAPKTSKK